MASTRRLEIFQDPGSAEGADLSPRPSYDFMGTIFSDGNLHSDQPPKPNIIFDPPPSHASNGRSPLKPVRQAPTSPPKPLFDNKTNIYLPPPEAPPFTTDSPTKQPVVSMYHPIAPLKSLKPCFTTFSSTESIDKENVHPTRESDNFAEFPDPSYGTKAQLKRSASNNAVQPDRPSKKGRREDSCGLEASDWDKMPLVADDGKKPPYSYATLIGMSILRSPGRRLTLAHIYKWIADRFSYYRLEDTGWQNSIRHNLSLNKSFIKQERPKDDPGKGNYWAIEPGMEAHFLKDKNNRRPTSSSGPGMKGATFLSSETNVWSSQPLLPPPPPAKAAPKSTKREPEVLEPSSDATIPASDAPSQDEETEDVANMPPPPSRLPLSSPLQQINSSPPVAHPSSFQNDTPSPDAEFAPSSGHSRSRKRKLAAMDDSGYFSSLDSSALRPLADPKLPKLTANKPRIKRGRAEEEIARIRSSSHDISPSKGRSILKQPTTSLISSSPLRNLDSTMMLPPLTPAVKFKLPQKPPASVSPNTNLRNHRNKIRELVGSPAKDAGLFSDDVAFSPAFNIVETDHNLFEDDYPTFSIFEDETRRPASTSPVKRSAQRPRTDRASRTSNILADVTGTALNGRASPRSKIPTFESPLLKKFHQPSFDCENDFDDEEIAKEDMFGLALLEDEEPDDFGGLDILQGFQKIGGSQNLPPSLKRSSRPPLGTRSATSQF